MDIWRDYIDSPTIDAANVDKAIRSMEEARLNLLSRSCVGDCNID